MLKITLGEALQQAVKETETFEQLKNFFRDNLDRKAFFIVNEIKRVFRRRGEEKIEVSHYPRDQHDPHRIIIRIEPKRLREERTYIPTLGEVIKEEGDG